MATPDFTWLFVKMVIALVIVVALAIVVLKYGGRRLQRTRSPWLTVIDRFPLTPKSSVYLVRLLGHTLALGVSETSVNLLRELTAEEGASLET